MRTCTILQIQFSRKNAKYSNAIAYKNHCLDCCFAGFFFPWIQRELDNWRVRYNNDKKRADKNKILPHGAPNDIYESPEKYEVLDFGVRTRHCL
jgi:hypothetical protein